MGQSVYFQRETTLINGCSPFIGPMGAQRMHTRTAARLQAYTIGGLRMAALPDLPTSSSSAAHAGGNRASAQQAAHAQQLEERFAILVTAREADVETLRRALFSLHVSAHLSGGCARRWKVGCGASQQHQALPGRGRVQTH